LRVLLINSNTKDDFLAAPPIGLCYVADATEAAGHQVKVLDLCFAGRHCHREVELVVRSFEPQVIGLSIRNIDNVNMLHPISYLPQATEIAAHIRSITSVPLVLGGSGASLMPEEILRLFNGSYIVVSDGEQCFVKLLRALEYSESCDDIPGLGMMRAGKFHLTPPDFADFSGTTPDIGKWVDIAPYLKIGATYNVQSRRGCRQKCIYCTYNQSLEGNRLRRRSPKEVVDEIEEVLLKYRPDTFEFVDSVFNDPVEHSVEILEEIVRRPWKTSFTAMGVSPRHLDTKFLNLMWRAGFRSFMITPETASRTMIENYGKGFDHDDVMRAAESINRTSFAAWWFFMIGGPGETNATLQESLDFALKYLQKNGRQVTHIADFFLGVRIYPGTKLWDIAVEEGFVPNRVDPLQTLWYVSENLDLDRAVKQMNEAASQAPEIYLGFDERVLMFSNVAATAFKLFGLPKPYWRYFRAANAFGLKTRIRFMFRPSDMARMVRDALKRQGYEGRGAWGPA